MSHDATCTKVSLSLAHSLATWFARSQAGFCQYWIYFRRTSERCSARVCTQCCVSKSQILISESLLQLTASECTRPVASADALLALAAEEEEDEEEDSSETMSRKQTSVTSSLCPRRRKRPAYQGRCGQFSGSAMLSQQGARLGEKRWRTCQ